MFDNIIFDLYGTLVDIHTDEEKPELWEGMARWYSDRGAEYGPGELRDGYFAALASREKSAGDTHEGHPEVEIGAVFRELFGDVPVDDKEIVRTAEHFRELSTDFIRLYPDAAELLSSLKASGKGVWLLTNAQRLFTVPELLRLGIADMFDGIYISSDYGVKKPDARFFKALLDERSIDPQRAIMVGNDGASDIMGARNVGLHTLYIRSDLSPREPTPKADFVLDGTDLQKVREIVLSNLPI